MKKHLFSLALLASAALAQAQMPAPTPASAPAPAPISAAKKELVQRILVIEQADFDNIAQGMVERPARQLMGLADSTLNSKVAPEKRKAVATELDGYFSRYIAETKQLVHGRTAQIGQASVGPLLAQKFSDDELRQLAAVLDSPAYKKYQASMPELGAAFQQKLFNDLQPLIEPKARALNENVIKALELTPPAADAKAAKPAASAASKPAKK